MYALPLLFLIGFSASPDDQLKHSYESKKGKYTAKFPGKPTEKTQEIPTAVGKVKSHMVTYTSSKSLFFAIAHVDYPNGHIKKNGVEKVLKGAREGAANNVRGKVASHKEIKMGELPGQEIKITSATGFELMGRHFISGDRLYQIFVVYNSDKLDLETNQSFLESLKISEE